METIAKKSAVLNKPQRRFKSFTDAWKVELLGELFTFKNGVNAEKEQYGSGYKFINVLDIIQNDFITHDVILGSVELSESDFKKNEVVYGDILFQRSSETREEVGQANAYLDKERTSLTCAIPLISVSMGKVTVFSACSGSSAPVFVFTMTCTGVMSGTASTGRVVSAYKPTAAPNAKKTVTATLFFNVHSKIRVFILSPYKDSRRARMSRSPVKRKSSVAFVM
jgi:hypothetical protein